ncbi:hypothetical protein AKO1_015602 [Acrasis kona]|uniref:alkaline phosphatase n=1 Tax=Acrasis kona TaxID=1008807 RepID=A0AAW2ZET4_9EUKA
MLHLLHSPHMLPRAACLQRSPSNKSRRYKNFLINGKKYALDVILGGGRSYFVGNKRTDFKSERKDDWDGIDAASQQGYNLCYDRTAMLNVKNLPIMGLFNDQEMKFNIDRSKDDSEPTLLEMSTHALNLLSQDNKNGFFLLIEGARIDHAGHNNDISAQYREVIQYNDVVQFVIDWATKDGKTLVVSTADHETGGVTLAKDVDSISLYDYNSTVTLNVNKSTFSMATLVVSDVQQGKSLDESIRSALLSGGLDAPITDKELTIAKSVIETETQIGNVTVLMLGLDEVINRRTRIGFSTTGHTGIDVNVYAFGPSRELFFGNQENIDLGSKVASLMDFDLAAITKKLNE